MKRVLKVVGILVLVLLVGGLIYLFSINESEPQGSNGIEADIMASEMLDAINKDAWDKIPCIKWTFRDVHHFIWDKHGDRVIVSWDEYEVDLDLKSRDGEVKKDGQIVGGNVAKEALEKAWSHFCNDSFWLNAPAKIMDEGTVRTWVGLEDGRDGVKVEYTKGGVTPGDSYVWLIGEDKLPTSYKMWVEIIPVGGIEFTWEDWKTLPGGAKIAMMHKNEAFNVYISDVATGNSIDELR